MNKSLLTNRHNPFKLAPTKLIVLSFAILILTGTLLLMLPVMSRDGRSAGLVTALFTATSAACVTGLVIVDTYNHWSIYGQLVIICLIQCGGLGIATLASFFSALLGRRIGIKGMILAQESINHFSYVGILSLVKRVVLVTFGIEFLGAMLLSIRFVPIFGVKGIYMGIFHSVSAFCNAGFDLMGAMGAGDFLSLVAFNNDPIILYTVAGLIVFSGLGFIVWKDFYEYRMNKSLSIHTKVVLVTTATLITAGAVFFFAFENNNPATMGKLDMFGKVNSTIFHSITTRTAGFNSLPLNDMQDISKLATTILMFIGGAPGSTAGGIKVTTFSVIIMAIISQIRGSSDTVIFRRRISNHTVIKALSIAGLGVLWVIVIATVIMAIENEPLVNVLYEVTSAFGTVGLTTGMTPSLSTSSKLLLALTMFIGRVGPVSFAIAVTLRSSRNGRDVVLPEGKIVVG